MNMNTGVDSRWSSYKDWTTYIVNFKSCWMVMCAFIFSFCCGRFVTRWDLSFFYNMTPCILVTVLKNVQVKANYTLQQEMKARKGS